MNEQLQAQLPEANVYSDLEKDAKSHDEIVALREMAQSDLAKTAVANPDNADAFDVTAIGSQEFTELNKQVSSDDMAVHSEDWHTEEK